MGEARGTVARRLLTALELEGLLREPLDDAWRARVAADPAAALRDLAGAGMLRGDLGNLDRCAREIADGVGGLARARAGLRARWADEVERRPSSRDGADADRPFAALVDRLRARCAPGDGGAPALLSRFEQIVCEGHPAHPSAKTSLGLGDSARDVLPEWTERFDLRFLALDRELADARGDDVLDALRAESPAMGEALAAELARRGLGGHVVVPVHPWQLEHVIRGEFGAELADGSLVVLDATAPAEPGMSVRTVRATGPDGASVHVKLALEAQLTGAVRGISAGAVAGPVVARALERILRVDSGLVPRTPEDAPAFAAAADLAAVRFRADDGIRAHCLGAVVRRDPAVGLPDGDVALPAAALQARDPVTGRIVLDMALDDAAAAAVASGLRMSRDDVVRAWFDALAEVLVVPAVSLLARWGAALEPHPQNVVLVLRGGVPVRAVVRDFGGARLLDDGRAMTWAGAEPGLADLRSTALVARDVDAVADKTSYPLLVNLLGGLARALSAAEEDRAAAAAGDRAAGSADVAASAAAGAPAPGLRDDAGEIPDPDPRILEPVALRLVAEAGRCGRDRPDSGIPVAGAVFERVLHHDLPRKRVLAMRLSGAVTEQAYVRVPNVLSHAADRALAAIAAEIEVAAPRALDEVRSRLAEAAAAEDVSRAEVHLLEADLRNSAGNLARAEIVAKHRLEAMRRRAAILGLGAGAWDVLRLAPRGLAAATADSLAVAGHNIHPMAKLRRGFDDGDNAAWAPESGQVAELRLIGVAPGLLERSGVGDLAGRFAAAFPEHVSLARAELTAEVVADDGARLLPAAAPSPEPEDPADRDWTILAVHPWQYDHVIVPAFAAELREGLLRPVRDVTLAVRPTTSLRTMVPHAPSADGTRPFVKVPLDVTVTSTRRYISRQSALGTPAVARLVAELVADGPAAGRVAVLPELAGTTFRTAPGESDERARGLCLLMRAGAGSVLDDGDVAVGASALRGRPDGAASPLADLAGDAPEAFLRAYARDLLGAVLPVLWGSGIALEAHLQNTMVRVGGVAGASGPGARPVYRGLVLRDFSGLRIHRGRLAAAGRALPAREGSVTVTDDVGELRDKAHYASVFGNLDGIVEELVAARGVDRGRAHRILREVAEEIIGGFGGGIPDGDVDALLAPTLHRKAFVAMAAAGGGDRYVDVPNPLADPAR